MMEALAQRFVASFRRGIEAEKAALRADSTAYEVPLEQGQRLSEMTQGEQSFYVFSVARPSDRLSPGVQCGLREPSGVEVPVTLVQIEGPRLTLRSEVALTLAPGDYRLVFVPWFLYDEMQRALDEVPFPEVALRTFGKVASERTPRPPLSGENALNASQQAAVQQAVESQLTLLWGPPGTGKTTALAELIAQLARLGRRTLIASTTHAALDQVLSCLARTDSLRQLVETGKVVRLGYSPQETFGCSLSEVVNRSQSEARSILEASLIRLARVSPRLSSLQPTLERCQRAASESQQLDLFADMPGRLSAPDLAQVLSHPRAQALAQQGADDQLEVLSRLQRRLEALEAGLKRRARRARMVLAEGQQQAVDESRVLLSTLANTYVSPLMKGQVFEAVVLEEAGMALLPAIYLAAGRSQYQVVLVGDPQQLPAILASRDPFAQQVMGRNIFEVLGDCPQRVMLDVQYRMHPAIGELVSQLFYGGALRHAASAQVEEIAARAPFPGRAVVVVESSGPCCTDPGDYSRYNPGSAKLAMELAVQAVTQGSDVAIIAPYRKQVRRIQGLLIEQGISLEQVHCATVHRFQGNERDVVILDTVDGPPMEPGTLLCGRGPRAASANLLNVSLSRARGKLIIIANVGYIDSRASGGILDQILKAASGNSEGSPSGFTKKSV